MVVIVAAHPMQAGFRGGCEPVSTPHFGWPFATLQPFALGAVARVVAVLVLVDSISANQMREV